MPMPAFLSLPTLPDAVLRLLPRLRLRKTTIGVSCLLAPTLVMRWLPRLRPRKSHHTSIPALPDTPYTLLCPIPVQLEPAEDGGWIACFEEANISMPGSDQEDALQMLAEDIVATFALFLAGEATLGPGPQHQLAALKRYLQVC